LDDQTASYPWRIFSLYNDKFDIEVEDGGTINDDLSILLEDAEYKTEQDFLDEDQELENQYLKCLQEIQNLKPLYREIVIDRLINGMKYEDISAKYDLPLQTIKNRILRGKRIIIDQIENNEAE